MRKNLQILVDRDSLNDDIGTEASGIKILVDLGEERAKVDAVSGRKDVLSAVVVAERDTSVKTSNQIAFIARINKYKGVPLKWPGLWPLDRLHIEAWRGNDRLCRIAIDTCFNYLSKNPKMVRLIGRRLEGKAQIGDDLQLGLDSLSAKSGVIANSLATDQLATTVLADFEVKDVALSSARDFGTTGSSVEEHQDGGQTEKVYMTSGSVHAPVANVGIGTAARQIRLDLDGCKATFWFDGKVERVIGVPAKKGGTIRFSAFLAFIYVRQLNQTLELPGSPANGS